MQAKKIKIQNNQDRQFCLDYPAAEKERSEWPRVLPKYHVSFLGRSTSTSPATFHEEEQSFTCKWLKFVLQIKLLFPNGAQVHLEVWADRILFDFLADLENFVCDTFRSRTYKIKGARGKKLEADWRRTALQRYSRRPGAGNTSLGEEYWGARGADQSLRAWSQATCSWWPYLSRALDQITSRGPF